ncbi:MAG: hypothetical protein Q8P49_01920 [Candidatus Liptonbacteria bacterium]|nr:hypothetical protein [Candidatus Liptonbacteria bacterium]
MGVSSKRNRDRHFSDVQARGESGVAKWRLFLGNRSKVVNLRPAFYKRRPVFAAITVVLVVGVSFFGLRRLFTRAEVADFYPSTCLGSWSGAQNAQGRPEMIAPASASTTFSENNSAIFNSGTGQIFCGGFVPPEEVVAGDVKSVGLTFVWQIGEPTATSSFPQGVQITEQETQNMEQGTQNIEQTDTQTGSPTNTQTSTQTITPENQSTTSRLNSKFYILNSFLISPAFAQTESPAPPPADPVISVQADQTVSVQADPPPAPSDTTVGEAAPSEATPGETTSHDTTPPASDATTGGSETPPQTPAPEPETQSTEQGAQSTEETNTQTGESAATTTIIIGPPLEATLAPIVSSTEPVTSTEQVTQNAEQITQITPPAPDDNFLQISYSTDGTTWTPIAKVNENNWQNFTVTLPLANWDELRKLQIQVVGIPTTLNPTPKVYLDGMFAEVHYDLPPVFAGVFGGGSSGGAAPEAKNGPVEIPNGIPVIVLPPSQKPTPVNPGQNTFGADEAPQFNLDLNSLVAPPPPEPAPDDSGE